jgi:CarD family transcriptional regulator
MAVYPAHGVGVIESIEQRRVGECEQSFYVMKILKNNMVIMIPTATRKRMSRLEHRPGIAAIANIWKK